MSLKSGTFFAFKLPFERHHKIVEVLYPLNMKNEIIQAVMEYYSTNRIEAIRIIKLRQSCGEYDELIRDLREEELNVCL